MAEKFVIDKHAGKLMSAVYDLYGKPNQYCDVEIRVGETVFKCHKLILALQSTYFHLVFGNNTNIVLDDTTPEHFRNVLRYLYTGEIELDVTTVVGIFRLANVTHLDDLKQVCIQFMRNTLNTQTCVWYWRAAQHVGDSELDAACVELLAKRFHDVIETSCLQYIPQDMMKAAIERDDLSVYNEVEVCEILLKWFDANSQREHSIRPCQLLSLVRWSAVNTEFIKSKIIKNKLVMEDPECFDYLSKVIMYSLSRIPFPGLRTQQRSSKKLEAFFVIIGTNPSIDILTRNVWRVSLQNENRVFVANIQTDLQLYTVACTNKISVYVTGLGANCNETWILDCLYRWTRGADMIQGRNRHCATFIDDSLMYALGGAIDTLEPSLSSVELFSTTENKWTTVGQLAQCVHGAGCVAYKTSVYVFGGMYMDVLMNKLKLVDCIQDYDTTTQQCSVLTQRLDRPRSLFRAVPWNRSVILMNKYTCLIFDLEQKTIHQRDQFAAGVSYFGLALDDGTMFVIGGGTKHTDSYGVESWEGTDEVKGIPVMDIVNNIKSINWTQHAKLKARSLIHAFSIMKLSH